MTDYARHNFGIGRLENNRIIAKHTTGTTFDPEFQSTEVAPVVL